ncbi:phospholipase [uncultured Bacteroides sp.]|uniref:phospholipase n=1 Tax=uncultured Bacteroides sp. TaxID=162156 RepID=UPI0026343F83|nr:phospholipase [uncultured Bacteroides sp.]
MWILVIILIGVAVFGLIAGYFYNRNIAKKIERGELTEAPEIKTVDSECCGQHEVCEKESLLAAVSKEIEYYDDEELDRFKGRPADQYSEEEIEEFRDVLYTMQEVEVAGWSRSLQLRGIELPDELKDELFLIVGERRFNQSKPHEETQPSHS